MPCAKAGIFDATAKPSAAYIDHWLGELRRDPKLVVHAAGKAQKAADLILGRTYDA
jgi:antirestriction protein ArdC